MAVAYGGQAGQAGTTAATVSFNSANLTGDSRIGIVGIAVREAGSGGPSPISAITWGGRSLTQAITSTAYTDYKTDIWYIAQPPKGISTITIYFDQTNDHYAATASYFTGSDGTVSNANDASGSSTAPSVTITSGSNKMVVDMTCVQYSGGDTLSVGASQTEIGNQTSTDIIGASSYEAGAASVVMDWSDNNSRNWVTAGLSINEGTQAELSSAKVIFF